MVGDPDRAEGDLCFCNICNAVLDRHGPCISRRECRERDGGAELIVLKMIRKTGQWPAEVGWAPSQQVSRNSQDETGEEDCVGSLTGQTGIDKIAVRIWSNTGKEKDKKHSRSRQAGRMSR